MQSAALLIALLAVSANAAGFGMHEARTMVAKVWLRSHNGAPNVDQLAELKTENPDAYALVNALLTKRSLGLLDPRHPTASFAHNAAPQEDVPHGPAAFANFATKTELAKTETEEPIFPEAAPVHRSNANWLNWRPSQSAMDDDNMVKNVLGSVAEISAPKKSNLLSQNRDEAPAFSPPPAAKVEVPVSGAATDSSNDYLDSIGGLGNQFEKPKPSLIKQTDHSDTSNALATFSWDDDSSQKHGDVSSQATSQADASSLMKDASDLGMDAPAPTKAPASAGGSKQNALMKWLR